MSIQTKFMDLQKHWIGRTMIDVHAVLKMAEDNEDYETCINIKNDIDKGYKMIEQLNVEKEYLSSAYEYPKLIFECFDFFNSLTEILEDTRVESEQITGFTFALRGHMYNTVRIHREYGGEINHNYLQDNPTHPDCGCEDEEYSYIIEKACNCGKEPASLVEITDHIIVNIMNVIKQIEEQQLRVPNLIQ